MVWQRRARSRRSRSSTTRRPASARRPSTPRSRARSTCASRATARRCGRSARPTARRGPTPATRPTSTGSPTRRSACTPRRPPPRARRPTRRASTTSRSTRRRTRATSSTARRSTSCRWTQIVRHEPGGYTVGGGNLTLPAAHGDFFANAPNNNPNILLQPAPSGPWTMTTRLTFNPNENYEQAGLLVYGDDANYVKADYRLRRRPRARVPARGEQRRGRLRRLREHLDAARRRSTCGSSPTGRRCGRTTASRAARGRRTASRRRWRACRTRRSASTPTTATRP